MDDDGLGVAPAHLSTPLYAVLLRGGATIDRDEIKKRAAGEQRDSTFPDLPPLLLHDMRGAHGFPPGPDPMPRADAMRQNAGPKILMLDLL